MSNIIRLNETSPNDEWLVMSNHGTAPCNVEETLTINGR